MNALPHSQRNIMTLIEQTLAGRSIISELQECLGMAVEQLLLEKDLLQQKTNYFAEGMRTRLKKLMSDRLLPLGYVDDFDRNQCRLICRSKDREPIRLFWCKGRVIKGTGCAEFDAPKGPLTIKAVHQNAEHFQPSMFPFAKRPLSTARETNLWLLYELDVKHEYLTSWLVLPGKIVTRKKLTCLDSKVVLFKGFGLEDNISPLERFNPNKDAFDVPFGIKTA